MNKPCIAQLEPYVLKLPAGEYAWCACGRSQAQPLCDGSHQQTDIVPIRFQVRAREGWLWLCGCKHTRRPPYCDGRHRLVTNKKGA